MHPVDPRPLGRLLALGLLLALPLSGGAGWYTAPAAAQAGPPADRLDRDPLPPRGGPHGNSMPRPIDPDRDGTPRSIPPSGEKGRAASKHKAAPPDTAEARAKALGNLYAHLSTAADAGEATAVAAAVEALWLQSGSDTVGLLLTRATQAMAEKRSDLARELFDAVVELAPDFAEGFARRAFFHYTENDTARALGDLRRALALEPNHYRALDGLATIMADLGEKRAALNALRQLELVHPYWPGLADSLREMERAVEGQGI